MFKKLLKNKKAQQTAEYALLISLVVAAVIAMQTYAQRTIQGRIRDASGYFVNQTAGLGNTQQYEPYYLQSDYKVFRDDTTTQTQDTSVTDGKFDTDQFTNSLRGKGGFQVSRYDTSRGLINGI